MFVPIINFHQQAYFLPNANKKTDILVWKNVPAGSLLRYYFWFHIAMGWILTSLAVAGFTGLVRRLE
ncbi:MAG: hypothetical protein AB4063_15015 [Crocosphaera sp.]